MEKEHFGINWSSSDAHLVPELHSVTGAGAGAFLNWEQQQHSMSQDAHFESAMSSLVSSPSSNPPVAAADSVAIRELIGRLGSICNSGEVSPTSRYHSAHNSCYSTPMNSPPKIGMPLPASQMPGIQLSPFGTDPGFVERAVKFSCFGGRNYGGVSGQFGLPETGKLSRVSSSKSLKVCSGSGPQIAVSENEKDMFAFDPLQLDMEMRTKFGGRMSGASAPEESEFGIGQEVSSVSNRNIVAGAENNARKRKAAQRGKGKETTLTSSAANVQKAAEEDNLDSKRSKAAETNGGDKNSASRSKARQNGDSGEKQEKDSSAKPPEPPKDYIHVRARRGQATDSHSLAERVRREKISERMKFLQDLVPGCNKVTGKAVMLDEIINYVQSLQRQVEFLSMKLATVNPRLDFNVETLLPKENHQACMPVPQQPVYPVEPTSSTFQFPHQTQGTPLQVAISTSSEPQCSINPLESSLQRNLSMQLPTLDGFTDGTSQLGSFWEDDLRSVVQMGFGQSQDNAFSSHSFHGN